MQKPYLALYRKYRPKLFSDVVGQDAITRTLRNEISDKHISHAYLFTGTRGTGKTTCAKIFAKAVNCLDPRDGEPCGECEACRAIENGSAVDVVEMDAASNNRIDDIRMLRDEVAFTPVFCKYRVYIIDEVHMLSISAFNGLLKTLEEPPEHVVFILATTDVQKLPVTILSRCQRFDFRRISPSVISARIEQVAKAEGREIDPDAAFTLAACADGAMRDALSLLDRCFVSEGRITAETAAACAGVFGRKDLFDYSEACAAGDCAGAIAIIDRLYESSGSADRLCAQLLRHFRDLLMAKSMADPSGVIVAGAADIDRLRSAANATTADFILKAINRLGETAGRIARSVNGRIEIEAATVALCLEASGAAFGGAAAPVPEPRPAARPAAPKPAAAQSAPAPKASGPIGTEAPEDLPFADDEPADMSRYAPAVPEAQQTESLPFDGDDDEPADMSKYAPSAPEAQPTESLPFDGDDDEPADMSKYAPAVSEAQATESLPFDGDDDEPADMSKYAPAAPQGPLSSDLPFGDDDDEPAEDPSVLCSDPSVGETPEEPFTQWGRVILAAAKISPPIGSLLAGSTATVRGDCITVALAVGFMLHRFSDTSNSSGYIGVLERAVTQVTGQKYRFKFTALLGG
ncbi:MAG: DNA polymerase III subunit gamma/tau [Clostridia bacterium]|nr:DNA polymerase III subunit gamma/tau [Clostridia bacterium]